MFQPNPPTPKAMSDDELNAKIVEVQLQPDGLVAAMALIEEQSRLRQEDALELSKWQLESQMHAATQPVSSDTAALDDPASPLVAHAQESVSHISPEPPMSTEPEVDIFASFSQITEDPKPTAEQPAEQGAAPAAPENIDDIVAALNASYAEVATEPEVIIEQAVETYVEVSEVHSTAVAPTQEEVVPEPVGSPVIVDKLETNNEDKPAIEFSDNQDQLPEIARPSALSWSWLAVASTPATLVIAAFLKDSGASLSQAVVLLAGVLIGTSLLAAVGSVASARGASTLTVISRAAFGVWGNAAPVALVLVAKLLWTAALLYFATKVISPLVSNQPWFSNLAASIILPAEYTAMILTAVPLLLLSGVIAGFGGAVMLRFQQVATSISVIGIAAFGFFVISSYSLMDLVQGDPLTAPALIDLGLLTVSIFGFAIFSNAGDFAKNLSLATPSSKVFFLSFVSTLFIPLIVGMLGLVWLYMAGDTLGSSFSSEALATVAAAAPMWVFVLFAVAIGVSLLYLISLSMHSLSMNRIGLIRIPEWVSQLGAAIKVGALLLVPSYLVAVSVLQESVVELLLVAAVVAAAWAGILVSDALIRTRGYHEVSLTREYGFYGKANPVNLIGFVLSVVLGIGYLNGGPQLTFWAGFLGDLTPGIYELVGSNIGIAMAFGLAVLFPVVFGIPRIRKQEQNLSELDQRRQELKEFLDSAQ